MVALVAFALLTSFLALTAAGSAEAGAIKVGTGTPASCTETALRTALGIADAQGGGTIQFKCGKDPVEIPVVAPIIVPDNSTLNGGGLITLAPAPRIVGSTVRVLQDTTVVVKGLTIRGDNRGVSNEGTLTLRDSTVTNSFLNNIVNVGTLTVLKSTISAAIFDVPGGGILNAGTLTVLDSTFTGNWGGAIWSDGTANISRSRFVGNFSPEFFGGAIGNLGEMVIRNSIIEGNGSASFPAKGGGIYNAGVLTVFSTRIAGNYGRSGGGILNAGELVLINSEVTGNTSFGSSFDSGGGIHNCLSTDPIFGDTCNGTPAVLKRTTVTGNTPSDIFPVPDDGCQD
jgi:hypothetical protein